MFYEVTASNTLVQAMSPNAMRGRAIAILSCDFSSWRPLELMAGFLGQRFGAPLTVAAGGAACSSDSRLFLEPASAYRSGQQLILANFTPGGIHR